MRGVEFTAELLQFGAVAQGGHGAAVVGRHPVGDQDALTAHGQQIRAGDPSGQHVGGAAGTEHVVERPADGRRVESEQPLGLVVEAYPAGPVQGDDSSRMPCNIASRSASSAEMSEKARSWVCRWTRRESRYAANAPTARAPPA